MPNLGPASQASPQTSRPFPATALRGALVITQPPAVLLNSAAALMVADRVTTLPDGVAMARESIDSGAADAKLRALVTATQSAN